MKYMLLIHQGSTPLPGTDEWDALSQEEQGAVHAAYGEIDQTLIGLLGDFDLAEEAAQDAFAIAAASSAACRARGTGTHGSPDAAAARSPRDARPAAGPGARLAVDRLPVGPARARYETLADAVLRFRPGLLVVAAG